MEITLDARITSESGKTWTVPAFWAGGRKWRVRFAPQETGAFQVMTECSDVSDSGLHGIEGVLRVAAGRPRRTTMLSKHGAVGIPAGGSHFAHADGTPFFWLGDTWWMLMSDRISWPAGFKALTRDRAGKGFTVVQTVIGFPGDITPFKGIEDNEGGPPWLPGYRAINPKYFDAVDPRIEHLVESDVIPCVLGGWGYHLVFMGEERMKMHWRYLVARYGAYPVIWCLAGEGAMSYYLSGSGEEDGKRQKAAWTEIARYVRSIDPWRRPLSIHPRRSSWDDVDDPEVLDFHMIQSGHFGMSSCESGVAAIEEARRLFPDKPVVMAEPPYEGHMGRNWQDVQRYAFWSAMLSGAAGFTYGAAAVFQANDRKRPTGNRPEGGNYDAVFWDESAKYPGSTQVGLAKKLLAGLPFEKMEIHPEWVGAEIRWGAELYSPRHRLYCAGVPGEFRIAFIPGRYYHWDGPVVRGIETGVRYTAWYFNPVTGTPEKLGLVAPGPDATWRAPTLKFLQDWVLLLKQGHV